MSKRFTVISHEDADLRAVPRGSPGLFACHPRPVNGYQDDKQSLEWLASNMVSWFSQRITVGESAWAGAFERTKIDGLWAYKPVSGGGQIDGDR